jgi:hypothetical protein
MSDLRAALETSFTEAEKEETPVAVETPEPSAPPAEPVQQSDPGAASESTASDPAVPVSSVEGSGATSETEVKSIEEVVGDAMTEATNSATELSATSSPPETPVPKLDQAPASWKGDAKQLWKELPVAARQEVMRRERDTLKVLQDGALDRRKVQEITEVLQPHMERISANYQGNPLTAINNLLTTERVLSSGTPLNKAQMVANIIQQFGIDINTLDTILSGQPPPAELRQQNDVERLVEERLRPVMDFVTQQQQRQQQQTQQAQTQIADTVESMATDPRFPYFDEVRLDMADIIEMGTKRGIDLSLEEAYNRAVRMNGHTAQAVETRQSTQAATQTALQAHQEAQRAKGAAVSIAGSPSTTSGPTVDPTDLRSLISSKFDNRGSRI